MEDIPLMLNPKPTTYCNPVNISYQYQHRYMSRESADPLCIIFNDTYYLFASHGEGFWYSDDMTDWKFVHSKHTLMTSFAPAACIVGDELYMTHSDGGAIYKTKDPKSGVFEYVNHPIIWSDPKLFTDDDGRVYAYYGCSNVQPVRGVELDPEHNMAMKSVPVVLIEHNNKEHGFEVMGDDNEKYNSDFWIEGAFMIKYKGRYYHQYAAPGTEYSSYADGYYVADSPLGKRTYAGNNPLSYKATGFARGAGHGCTIQDKTGRWWKFDTISVSVHWPYERRLCLLPANFDKDDRLICNTVFADYPAYLPHSGSGSFENPGPDWNLLSYGKKVTVSSELENRPAADAVNENMKNWWSAATGDAGEWMELDLGRVCDAAAVQINFADQDIQRAHGRDNSYIYRYTLEISEDGANWRTAVDKSQAEGKPFAALDTSHDYFEFAELTKIRYLRLINRGPVPAGGKFAVSGLRVFGYDYSEKPGKVTGLKAVRNPDDRRSVSLTWDAVPNAEGYIIRFGETGTGMNLHYQVIGGTEAKINILNTGAEYEFAAFAYSAGGKGEIGDIINIS